ncbi:MAG: shikimate dehydrogenase [Parafilimonas sp.]
MQQYGLIGYPLSHSFSQKYFIEKFKRERIAGAEFLNFEIAEISKLAEIIKTHPQLLGFAITIPYKKSILQFLSMCDDVVKQTGCCNCVKISNKKLLGYNTDVIGFEKSFVKQLQAHHTKALILGTGGAAAAAEFILKKLKMEYIFVSRTASEEKNILNYKNLNEDILHNYTIIINCTPLGMYPNIDEAPQIPYGLLTPKHYLFDMIYNPAKTKFLLGGEQHSATIQNGNEMLVIQAEENLRIWNS